MAALDMIIHAIIRSPDQEIIAGDDLYGGTNRLLSTMANTSHHVDTTDLSAIAKVLDPIHTRLVLLETPTNPLLKIADIRGIVALVRKEAPKAMVVVDNSMMR
jgi:cystathionine beta-lyase